MGERGFYSVSRSLKYGIVDSVTEEQQKLNSELALLVQIETKEALDNIEEIVSVPGVDIFIGPADLAASLGVPGQTAHPILLEAAAEIVRVARKHNKKVVTACGAADFIHWTRLGIDLLFCTNDIVCLRAGAQLALKSAAEAIRQAAEETSTAGLKV
jgi:2-keto-3-deoxy-L-rhamnonate aldolase RhmA